MTNNRRNKYVVFYLLICFFCITLYYFGFILSNSDANQQIEKIKMLFGFKSQGINDSEILSTDEKLLEIQEEKKKEDDFVKTALIVSAISSAILIVIVIIFGKGGGS